MSTRLGMQVRTTYNDHAGYSVKPASEQIEHNTRKAIVTTIEDVGKCESEYDILVNHSYLTELAQCDRDGNVNMINPQTWCNEKNQLSPIQSGK